MVVSRKPVARRPVAAPKTRAAAPAAKREASKPAVAAKKAAPAKRTPDQRNEQLAAARAARTERVAQAKAAPTKVHPARKEEVTAHDVLRAQHTYFTLYATWLKQEGEELSEVLDFVAPIMDPKVGTPKKSPLTRAKVEPEERVIDEYYDRDKIDKYSLKELRELAVDLAENGIITETKLKTKILAEMEAAGLFREEGSADADEDDVEDDLDEESEEVEEDDSDDEDSDDDDAEDVVYSREDLKAMRLKELQELAEANEYDWKGLGKDELIDALLADDEDGEEESEEADEEEDDDDEEVVGIDPDELPNMGIAELLELCQQIELKVPASKKKNKNAIIQLIMDELEDEEE